MGVNGNSPLDRREIARLGDDRVNGKGHEVGNSSVERELNPLSGFLWLKSEVQTGDGVMAFTYMPLKRNMGAVMTHLQRCSRLQ